MAAVHAVDACAGGGDVGVGVGMQSCMRISGSTRQHGIIAGHAANACRGRGVGGSVRPCACLPQGLLDALPTQYGRGHHNQLLS